jgi:hypothetical protein
MPGGASQAQSQIPGFTPNSYVLAKNVYWFVLVNTGPNFPGGTVTMDINATTVWNRGFPAGVTSNDYYDFASRSADAFTNSSGINIEVTVS